MTTTNGNTPKWLELITWFTTRVYAFLARPAAVIAVIINAAFITMYLLASRRHDSVEAMPPELAAALSVLLLGAMFFYIFAKCCRNIANQHQDRDNPTTSPRHRHLVLQSRLPLVA